MSAASRVALWDAELRVAVEADDGSLQARARVVRAESTLRYWEAVASSQARKVLA